MDLSRAWKEQCLPACADHSEYQSTDGIIPSNLVTRQNLGTNLSCGLDF